MNHYEKNQYIANKIAEANAILKKAKERELSLKSPGGLEREREHILRCIQNANNAMNNMRARNEQWIDNMSRSLDGPGTDWDAYNHYRRNHNIEKDKDYIQCKREIDAHNISLQKITNGSYIIEVENQVRNAMATASSAEENAKAVINNNEKYAERYHAEAAEVKTLLMEAKRDESEKIKIFELADKEAENARDAAFKRLVFFNRLAIALQFVLFFTFMYHTCLIVMNDLSGTFLYEIYRAYTIFPIDSSENYEIIIFVLISITISLIGLKRFYPPGNLWIIYGMGLALLMSLTGRFGLFDLHEEIFVCAVLCIPALIISFIQKRKYDKR